MEEKLKERIHCLRIMLNNQGLDVDKLVTILKRDLLLPPKIIVEIEKQPTSADKLDILVDQIVSAKDNTYQKLLLAVEQCVPLSRSGVFTTPPPYHNHRGGPESCSGSDDDSSTRLRVSLSIDGPSKDLPVGYGKSAIFTTQPLNHSASSSFPGLNDRYSPLLASDDRHNERNSPMEAIRKQISADSRFDWFTIKMQFEGALGELEALKQQNAEKMSQLSKDVDLYRNMYKRSEAAYQHAHEELRTVQTLNVNLMAAKQQLQEDLAQLKKLRAEDEQEMIELRAEHHKAISALSDPMADTSDMFTDLYDSLLQKYDILRKDYDDIRGQFKDLSVQHSSACCQLEAMDDLRKQLDEMRRERDAASRDRLAFQHQCTTVIQNLDQLNHEHRKLRAALDSLRHEHEGCVKDQRQAHLKLAQMQKECSQVLQERDAAIQEYRQVMSERDTVHKEIEQLQDKLSEMSSLTDKYRQEKLATEKEMEHLQGELNTAVASREKLRQESQGAIENRAQLEAERRELKRELQLMEQQRDTARMERKQVLEQMEQLVKEHYEKTKKEKEEEMDQVAKEKEVLKKQIDKIKHELTDAAQEAMVATKRRDWAFSEIDKTVQERESIRTLCDNLRRDRDRAVSELAKALRNSDECEKQKNDAVKELKEIREKYEALVERDARRQQLNSVGHNHSRDSAIDADLQEWETETLEIDLEGGDCHDLGFDLVGGKESPLFRDDNSLFISHVAKGGFADGKLRVNDMLLKVNNLDTINIERRRVEQALRKHSRALMLVVRRRKFSLSKTWQPLHLQISCLKEGSIQLEQGLFISAVHSSKVIGRDGILPSFGDRLISINRHSADSLSPDEAIKLVENSSQPVELNILRQISPVSSTGSSPTPTTVSIMSPLPENLSPTQAAQMSKSDSLATSPNMTGWDSTSGDSARSGGGSSKNLRSSGSQTDSLDSPGPSPPKSLRNHDHEKIRHSMPVLDIVDKLFRSRHKSQDRERTREADRHSRDEICDKGHSKDKDRGDENHPAGLDGDKHVLLVSSNTQTSFQNDDVIAEFPASAFSHTSPDIGLKCRKREFEADSNSGTWPKSRSGIMISSGVPSTVTLVPPKERPSIKDPGFFQPPSVPANNGSEGGGAIGPFIRDQGVMSRSQESSDIHSTNYPTPLGMRALSPLPKSSPQFSVSVLSPTAPAAFNRPVFSKQWPTPSGPYSHRQGPLASTKQGYPPPPPHHYQYHPHHSQPLSRQQPPYRPPSGGPLPHNPVHIPRPIHPPADPYHTNSSAQPLHVPQKAGGKSQRLTSALHHVNHEKHWLWGQPPVHPGGSGHHLPSNSYTTSSMSPDIVGPMARPTSLEVPHHVRIGELPGDDRVLFPAAVSLGPGISAQSGSVSSYNNYSGSNANHHSSRPLLLNPRYSSPPGMLHLSTNDPEIERVLFQNMGPSSQFSGHHSSPSPSQQSFSGPDRITPTPSEEFNITRYFPPTHSNSHTGRMHLDEYRNSSAGSNYKHDGKHVILERIRIPSSNSMTSKSGSVEIVSDRSSPVSSIYDKQHEPRTIRFEKSSDPVGFQIQGGPAGGIFVSSVNDNSLASQAGLVIGDQLLEVCGINMRNATHEHAVTVLRQCGDNLTMKVQYNPEKYMDGIDSSSTLSAVSSVAASPVHSKRSSGDSEQSTPKHHAPQRSKSNSSADGTYERPHVVQFQRQKGDFGPGFSIVGGNAVGIYIHEIQSDSAAAVLQRGDRILEYNNVSFRSITAEEGLLELNKQCNTMRFTVLSSLAKYNKIQNIPGDHFFVRTNFSRTAEADGELDFRKDNILVVENTMHRGQLGLWLAWIVDDHGNKIRCGSIPSKLRLEDEMVLRRSHSESWSLGDSEELKGTRRGSGSARRSFFRRKRHQRNSSKDSRDLGGSFSDASLNSESVPILDESVMGYTQVERVEYNQTRPVVLLAPLAEALICKLTSESPDKYRFCERVLMRAFKKDMEQNLAEGRLVDYWPKEDCDFFECIQTNHIREICAEKIHCMLNVNPRAIERLHRLKIYPIVIFVRHKSYKQIKEIRDGQFLPEKLNNKTAKESFEHFCRVEEEYSHLFSVVIPGGNLAEMCNQIKTAINNEQMKAIWVSVPML